MLPGTGGTQRLARMVGRSKAIELMALGTNLSVEEAHALGLVNALVDDAGFDAAVATYAKKFVPPGKASKAVGAIKRAVDERARDGLRVGPGAGARAAAAALRQRRRQRGHRAYVEKRAPAFKGR